MADVMPPVPPLVIRSEDGLVIFRSVSAARGYIEVPDVEDGVYGPAFDAEGRALSISLPIPLLEEKPSKRRPLARVRWKLLGPSYNAVSVELLEDRPNHRAELVALLQSVLRTDQESLGDLLAAAVDHFGIDG